MEKAVDEIVFRRMTYADFFNINKKGGEEQGGGGQSYFDIPVNKMSIAQWIEFLGKETANAAKGPYWEFPINSLGLSVTQTLKIYQRAKTRCAVASQKLPEYSRSGNRVEAWHPKNSFPVDYDPELEKLIVYIIKSKKGDYWAGWFLKSTGPNNWRVPEDLKMMFKEEAAGYIRPDQTIFFDTRNKDWPFYLAPMEDELEVELLEQDISSRLEDVKTVEQPELKERIIKIRKRNTKITKNLKGLYNGRCQITGEEFTFRKKDGEFYSEAHHLIALGDGGSDDYRNIIIISPLIHRMLHYAQVSEIDLTKIEDNKLIIQINGSDYTITWHPEHARTVERSVEDEQ